MVTPINAPRITSHGLWIPTLTLLCATNIARIKTRKDDTKLSLRKVTASQIEKATAA